MPTLGIVSTHLCKRDKLCKDKPDIYHLDISCLGEGARHADEDGGQHQLAGQVHSHYGFKEELFEEVCRIDDDNDKNRGEVGG